MSCLRCQFNRQRRQTMEKRQCVCYSCHEHATAPVSDDHWVNLVRAMIRDGRLVHVDTDESGRSVYRSS
jgi:hypothetical protein